MVFYLIEVFVLTIVCIWYYKEPKTEEVKIVEVQTKGPAASDLIKMRNLKKQIERGT
jgi:hypothetical protein